MIENIQKQAPLYLQVYETFKKSILEGRWSPGEKIVESKIAAELNLSRSPVREAIRLLEFEGLLVKKDQHIFVHNPSVEDIVELYECRLGMEALTCYLAAGKATEEEKVEMERILEETEKAIEEGNTQKILECNTRFHEAIIYSAKNKHLLSIMETLRSKTLYCRNVLLRYDYVRTDNFLGEHRDIYLAIRNKNKEEAKRLMEEHITTDLNRILALFNNENDLTIRGNLQ
ncbi:GntR family transcriptional regulator [Evansella clarkii]|uniref:GntR family transcriptional regulator n=1 Tax=Evansella clarkii TaxID=79879 RepID=UPI000B44E840|nr:GntR family transcriptional regulator [Evansella clarkii]